jgi:thymidylate synthase ThyX
MDLKFTKREWSTEMKIERVNLGASIFGTEKPLMRYRTDKFPLAVSLLAAPANPEHIAAANYKTCIEGELVYPQTLTDKEAKETFKWVMQGGHTPSLECIHLTFGVENASVVLLKQISRHRIGNSLGVMTQRAKSEEWLGNMYDGHYVTPPSFMGRPKVHQAYNDLVLASQNFYNLAIAEGIQQDEARYGIIQGAKTLWHGTYSYKTVLDSICSTRMCHIMQGEMVALSHLMAAAVKDYNELMGDALKPICLRYGNCNRNENNPTKDHPKGVCKLTIDGTVPVRKVEVEKYDLTQYSKDATK